MLIVHIECLKLFSIFFMRADLIHESPQDQVHSFCQHRANVKGAGPMSNVARGKQHDKLRWGNLLNCLKAARPL